MSNDELKLSDKQKLAVELQGDIEKACIKRGLNLTIYNGKIGFVDQKERKIVMLWNPNYTLKEDTQNANPAN